MNESGLNGLLIRGARRLRFESALRMAFMTLGLTVVLLALVIAWFRLRGDPAHMIGGLFLPPLLGLAALLAAYKIQRPSYRQVALLLDKQAQSHEHLATWYAYQGLSAETLSEAQCGFRDAQRNATLELASNLDAGRLIPITLPVWSRAIWLALLLLCCALLMPPQKPSSQALPSEHRVQAARTQIGLDMSTGSGANSAPAIVLPRVQVLSPTELRRFQLLATDARLTDAAKADVLKDLQGKIGTVAESELAPEVREVLDMLRSSTPEHTEKKGKTEAASAKGGNQQGAEAAKSAPHSVAVAPVEALVNIPEFKEKAFAAISLHFSDVQEQLNRYYKQ